MFKRLLFATMALAAAVSPLHAEDDWSDARSALKKIIPSATHDSLSPSPVPGFLEAVYGAEVYYISNDGRYFINGSVIDVVEEKNITEDKRTQGRLAEIAKIDESEMIIYSPEKVKHSVTVFTDIDCGYCRRLHREMEALNEGGVEIRYLFFPRAGKPSRSYDKAVSVWCADDRLKALTDAKAGINVPDKTCDTPIDKHMELVERFGITGTPTMILSDGTTIPGYIPAERLIPTLNNEHSK